MPNAAWQRRSEFHPETGQEQDDQETLRSSIHPHLLEQHAERANSRGVYLLGYSPPKPDGSGCRKVLTEAP